MNITKNLTLLTLLLLISSHCLLQAQDDIFNRWQNVDTLIRDRKIDKDAAIDSLKFFSDFLTSLYSKNNASIKYTFVFPMVDYTEVKYRTNGNDYIDEGFDYFQGGEYTGHPAHDIFVLDKDSNGVDDSTNRKVTVVSSVNGYVISIYQNWKKGDYMRSGNYVKVFDPVSDGIYYYSHLDSIFVRTGMFVMAGQPLAYVGRTGRKAIKGKTHLHTAYYKINNGYPEPVNIIRKLYKAEKIKN